MATRLARPRTRARSPFAEQTGSPLAAALGPARPEAEHAMRVRAIVGDVPPGVGQLSWAERLDILDALSQVIEGLYAHLPLKRALYGFDPVRALARLRQHVPTLTDLQFHRELTTLMNRLRDAHTQYSGPNTIAGAVARLPFVRCGQRSGARERSAYQRSSPLSWRRFQ